MLRTLWRKITDMGLLLVAAILIIGAALAIGLSGRFTGPDDSEDVAQVATQVLPTTVTVIASPSVTMEPTIEPTTEPTATIAPTATHEPTATATVVPTATIEPTATPTSEPTEVPTAEPTEVPVEIIAPEPSATEVPTAAPTAEPTATIAPTATPKPTATATILPTATTQPTEIPNIHNEPRLGYVNVGVGDEDYVDGFVDPPDTSNQGEPGWDCKFDGQVPPEGEDYDFRNLAYGSEGHIWLGNLPEDQDIQIQLCKADASAPDYLDIFLACPDEWTLIHHDEPNNVAVGGPVFETFTIDIEQRCGPMVELVFINPTNDGHPQSGTWSLFVKLIPRQ